MRNLNVAVLGANGFIGNYLANNLKEFNVLRVTRDIVDLTNFVQTQKFFDDNKIYCVINCAIHSDSTMDSFSPEVAMNNLSIFSNLYSNRNKFSKLINFG
jgi:dTDP-4-dehydrorhamnose reductase